MEDIIKACLACLLLFALCAIGVFGDGCQKSTLANVRQIKQALE